MIKVSIAADSISKSSRNRIITYVCTYPRFIHSEIMTHRMLTRNAASSRAIPIDRMIKMISETPAEPFYWGKNQKGMQATQELTEEEVRLAREIWLESSQSQIKYVKELSKLGVHKQIANRLLEPFAHMTTLITGTEWGNFFNLRAHPDAQPEFQELAYQMLEAYIDHQPTEKEDGEWHLPFSDKYISEGLTIKELLKITTARAARVSYLNFEGNIDHKKDYELHDSLITNGHWSPLEHAARAMSVDAILYDYTHGRRQQANFNGWSSYRKTFEHENQAVFNAEQLINRRRGSNEQKNTMVKMDRPT